MYVSSFVVLVSLDVNSNIFFESKFNVFKQVNINQIVVVTKLRFISTVIVGDEFDHPSRPEE